MQATRLMVTTACVLTAAFGADGRGIRTTARGQSKMSAMLARESNLGTFVIEFQPGLTPEVQRYAANDLGFEVLDHPDVLEIISSSAEPQRPQRR